MSFLSLPLVLHNHRFYQDLTLLTHSAFPATLMCRATAASPHLWQEENMGLQPLLSFLPDTTEEISDIFQEFC